jgi:hypothetical protein
VGTLTQTIKGTTTTRYGMSGTTYGSVTLGNLTTYPGLSAVTGINTFLTSASSSQTPPFSQWSGQMNFSAPSAPPAISGRLRVGNNNVMPSYSTVTYVAGSMINSFSVSSPLGVMVAADVGETLDWVMTQ